MNVLQKYFAYRQNLIDQYLKGDMTKREYLARNLEAVVGMGIKPFKNIDTVEKGLFNYHYYNAMAKNDRENPDHYYRQKDRSTEVVLRLLDYRGVRAYFIHVRSMALRGRLYEIVLEDYEMILHSQNQSILNKLRAENAFSETVQVSLIDGYVNQKY